MVMRTINVTELKAHLSEYLRRAQNGERIVVRDRGTPIAELAPLRAAGNVWERLSAEKGLRLGNGSSAPFTPSKTHHKIGWERHILGKDLAPGHARCDRARAPRRRRCDPGLPWLPAP